MSARIADAIDAIAARSREPARFLEYGCGDVAAIAGANDGELAQAVDMAGVPPAPMALGSFAGLALQLRAQIRLEEARRSATICKSA
jgi:hypothetical protein